ncbi:hypothetical protein GUITHDRAFT_104525 [Guillardia theta CCMP2712]|uniref:Uncharacterized protein n=1 Tax=Guillardia theta (strain CCMP2712) TaxID=905079 RepID=L1JLW5_GUITC|nr:hypothetical protein GUITHDRAFT_104525 [Guillardia theta CCMP2712]EKX49561.1 hypothetical protein GUITHDRAFT_104525 [Guillardia theta CCMP2712]|eukprot:XP_005836541.1 hypothetical protein GUITHDRAFT_104525 [Guillardia theta CCMP2712]
MVTPSPRKKRMIALDVGYRTDLEWLVWTTKKMEDSLSRAETVTEEVPDASMLQLEETRRSVMEMAKSFKLALDAQARMEDDYQVDGDDARGRLPLTTTVAQGRRQERKPSYRPADSDSGLSSWDESGTEAETGIVSRASHATQSLEDVDSSFDSSSMESQRRTRPPQELALSSPSSWGDMSRSESSLNRSSSTSVVTYTSTFTDESTLPTTSTSTSTSTSTIQDLADTQELMHRRAMARQQRARGAGGEAADARLVSSTGIPLTIGYIPGVVPVEMSKMLQTDSDRMFDKFQSKIDRSLALHEKVSILDQLDSAYMQTLNDETITRRVDKKPPGTITLFLDGKHEKVKVNTDDIHGSVSVQRDEDGILHTVYNPIGLSDLQRGVAHEDLQLCPPEMQRAVKLRSALLSRRAVELRQLEKWLEEETAVLEVIKEEFRKEVDNTRYLTKKLVELEETMREKPLQRENMKKQIQHDMFFYQEALQRCQRQHEEVQEQSRKTVEIRERFCEVRKMLLRNEAAHHRDIERIKQHLQDIKKGQKKLRP